MGNRNQNTNSNINSNQSANINVNNSYNTNDSGINNYNTEKVSNRIDILETLYEKGKHVKLEDIIK